MATPFAIFTIDAYIVLSAVGTLAFWTLAYQGYRRDTAPRPAAILHELREAA